jgi:hypothetical protein
MRPFVDRRLLFVVLPFVLAVCLFLPPAGAAPPGENSSGPAGTFFASLSTPPTIDFADTCPETTILGSGASVDLTVTGNGSAVAFQSLPDGSYPLETSKVGRHKFTVSAVDDAGNKASDTCTYQVLYDLVGGGFFAPIQAPPALNPVKGKVTLTWQLRDANGRLVRDRRVLKEAETQAIDCADPVLPIGDRVPVPHGRKRALSFKARTGLYAYNWTPPRGAREGCFALFVTFKDGTEHRANFRIVR